MASLTQIIASFQDPHKHTKDRSIVHKHYRMCQIYVSMNCLRYKLVCIIFKQKCHQVGLTRGWNFLEPQLFTGVTPSNFTLQISDCHKSVRRVPQTSGYQITTSLVVYDKIQGGGWQAKARVAGNFYPLGCSLVKEKAAASVPLTFSRFNPPYYTFWITHF